MANPILPPNKAVDKTQTWPVVRSAESQVKQRFSEYARALTTWLDGIDPPVGMITNAEKYYFYQLDALLLGRIDDELERLRTEIIMSPSPGTRQHFIETAAALGYESGTRKAIDNLDQITDGEYPRVVEFVLMSDPYRDRLAYVSSRALEEMAGLSEAMKADIRRTLTDGMAAGRSPREIARAMRKRVGVSASRAMRIARTEVTTAHRRAIWDEDARANAIGIETKLLHVSALIPGRTRHTHAQKHGHIWRNRAALEDWYSVDGNGINCFLPGTKVSGRFIAGSKASYNGPVISLVTASGRNITITPNHPVMTDHGLVPANKITKGDNLVAHFGEFEHPVGPIALNINKAKPSIEDVYGSLVKLGHSFATRVGAVDFHGDAVAMDKNIEVVYSEGVLTTGGNASTFKLLDYFGFKHANPPHLGHCAKALRFFSVFLSSPSLLRGRYNRFFVLFAFFLESLKLRIRCIPPIKSMLFEPSIDSYSGQTCLIGYLKDAFTRNVLIKKINDVVVGFDAIAAGRGISFSLHSSGYGCNAVTGLDRNIPESAPVGVLLDRVVDCRVEYYSGHVYDLQEVSGVMIANGIMTSNCLCTTVSVLVDGDKVLSGQALIKKMRDNRKKFVDTSAG